MEKLVLQYDSMIQAYKTLEEAIQLSKVDVLFIDPKLKKLCQDGLLQRFEYCYEVTWKYLKEYCRYFFAIEVTSPKTVFQECWKQKIINESELEQCINMINDRNKTSHIYSEKQAEIISEHIENYMRLMNQIADRVIPTK